MKIQEKRLGRQKALGMADTDEAGEKIVIIDPTQKSRERMDTVIHEGLHHLCPEWSERKVAKSARLLSGLLWKDRFRRVET